MKLEKAIKSKFRNEHQKAMINIVYTGNWLNSESATVLKPFGISPQQYNILRILRGQYPKPASVKLLKERMLDKMSNASRLVEKLKQKGFVDRQTCENDRRQVDVTITESGLKLLDDTASHFDSYEQMEKRITLEEAKELNRILDKFRS